MKWNTRVFPIVNDENRIRIDVNDRCIDFSERFADEIEIKSNYNLRVSCI